MKNNQFDETTVNLLSIGPGKRFTNNISFNYDSQFSRRANMQDIQVDKSVSYFRKLIEKQNKDSEKDTDK